MSDEKSKKIKDVIKVLSDLLDSTTTEPEAETNSSATCASDLPGPSTPTQPSDHSQEAISRPLSACDRALETLRRLRQSEQTRNFEPYAADDRSRGKGKRRSSSTSSVEIAAKSSKSVEWNHRFVCLASKSATKVPTKCQKALLQEDGLGEKTLSFPMDTTPTDFRRELCKAFPPLIDAGGFELLHCLPNTKDLSLIANTRPSRPIANLQQNTGKGRIYIRPIQEDLITAKDSEDTVEEVNKYDISMFSSSHTHNGLLLP